MANPIVRRVFLFFMLVFAWRLGLANADSWPVQGKYVFDGWDGPDLAVHFTVPGKAGPDTPILIVIPGARRNSDEYRDQWHDLAVQNSLIVLAIGCSMEDFPTEWDYNAGGVTDRQGWLHPPEHWLFSAIDPIFDDFKNRLPSNRKSYSIYGHSAGGGFVHRFALFQPDSRYDVAIAANPAFVTLPDFDVPYPFGLRGAPIQPADVKQWLQKPLVILLGDQDLGPRTKPLSNSEQAKQQGSCVFTRGLRLFQDATEASKKCKTSLRWKLDIVHQVGHSNADMAPHAIGFLRSTPSEDTRHNSPGQSPSGH